jgi:membrane fusion protein (multidrug efflux system)
MMNLDRVLPLPAAIVLLLLAGACSQTDELPAPEPTAEVTITPATTGDLPVVVTGYGTVEFDPAGQRTLATEIEARVLALEALPGDVVKKGEVVLRLGPSSSTAVEIARVRRDALAAEAAAARARRLRTDGFASDGDVETAESAAKDFKTLADSLESRAGEISSLRAPIAGVVDALFVEPGDLVSPGAQLVRLASHDAVQARVGVEIEDAIRLSDGAPVRLSGIDGGGLTVDSVIRTIDYRVDPASRMTSVFVPIPPGQGLLSGEAVRAELTAEVRRGVVLAPRESVFVDETGPYVFVEVDGKAVLRRVETGVTVRGLTEMVSGLTAGEGVIVEGAAVLSDGMLVREAGAAAGTQP